MNRNPYYTDYSNTIVVGDIVYCHKCLIDVNRDIIMDDSSKTN